MKSSATKQDAVVRTAAIAMHAVAKYALDQRLPAPQSIRRPRVGQRAVRVNLFVDDHDAWVDVLEADYLSTLPVGEQGRSVVVRWTGKVPSPIGDVEVELRIVQRVHLDAARPLTLVPGGAA